MKGSIFTKNPKDFLCFSLFELFESSPQEQIHFALKELE